MADLRRAMGRPTDEELTVRILAETHDQLVEHGYAGLKIGNVVQAVGCGKSAIYRRYPDKPTLVAAAIMHVVKAEPIPDTGSVVEDLVIHAQQNQATQVHAESRAVGRALFDSEVFAIVQKSFLSQRRDAGRRILERAIARQELPPHTAQDIILDAVAGFTLYRQTVKGIPIENDQYRAVIAALVLTPPLLPTTENATP